MIIIILIISHYIADYIANKNAFGKEEIKLNIMSYIYLIVMTCFSYLAFFDFQLTLVYSLIVSILHLYVNKFTNILYIKYKGDDNKMFKLIGLDHTIHLVILISIYYLMVSL